MFVDKLEVENSTLESIDVRSEIIAQFHAVAAEHRKKIVPLDGAVHLLDTGLDSLCFAIVVARLEDRLGFDPFSTDGDISFPVTFGDFVRLYDQEHV